MTSSCIVLSNRPSRGRLIFPWCALGLALLCLGSTVQAQGPDRWVQGDQTVSCGDNFAQTDHLEAYRIGGSRAAVHRITGRASSVQPDGSWGGGQGSDSSLYSYASAYATSSYTDEFGREWPGYSQLYMYVRYGDFTTAFWRPLDGWDRGEEHLAEQTARLWDEIAPFGTWLGVGILRTEAYMNCRVAVDNAVQAGSSADPRIAGRFTSSTTVDMRTTAALGFPFYTAGYETLCCSHNASVPFDVASSWSELRGRVGATTEKYGTLMSVWAGSSFPNIPLGTQAVGGADLGPWIF